MRIDPAGFPFIGISLAAGLAAGFWGGWPWASGLLVLTAFFLFFFRDPDRVVTAHPDAVLSPADGRVMVAGAPAGQARRAQRLDDGRSRHAGNARARPG